MFIVALCLKKYDIFVGTVPKIGTLTVNYLHIRIFVPELSMTSQFQFKLFRTITTNSLNFGWFVELPSFQNFPLIQISQNVKRKV